jgi:hypothetical protein
MTQQGRHFRSRTDSCSQKRVTRYKSSFSRRPLLWMRKSMVNAILPVGWPPLSETLDKVVAKHIPIFA